LLREIRSSGRTVVLTTHHMDEAESLCDRVAIMDHGKILKAGPPATLVRELDQPGTGRDAGGRLPQPDRTGVPRMRGGGFTSLSRAMFLGFVRDRAALIFSILLPVLFLLFFGSIYKDSSAPKISLVEVGRVQLLSQARHADPGLAKVLAVSHGRSLAAALDAVRKGNDDAAVLQRGTHIIVRYSIADQIKAGLVNSVLGSMCSPPTRQLPANRPGSPSRPTRSKTRR
jgi:hypothetical protein